MLGFFLLLLFPFSSVCNCAHTHTYGGKEWCETDKTAKVTTRIDLFDCTVESNTCINTHSLLFNFPSLILLFVWVCWCVLRREIFVSLCEFWWKWWRAARNKYHLPKHILLVWKKKKKNFKKKEPAPKPIRKNAESCMNIYMWIVPFSIRYAHKMCVYEWECIFALLRTWQGGKRSNNNNSYFKWKWKTHLKNRNDSSTSPFRTKKKEEPTTNKQTEMERGKIWYNNGNKERSQLSLHLIQINSFYLSPYELNKGLCVSVISSLWSPCHECYFVLDGVFEVWYALDAYSNLAGTWKP